MVTCPAPPQIEHHVDTSDAEVYLESWEAWGCTAVDGGTVEAWAADGQLVSTCTIESGICHIEGTFGDLPITLVRTDTPASATLQLDWGNTLDESNVGWRMALVYVQSTDGITQSSTDVAESNLIGRVLFNALSCPQEETTISVVGPGIALDYGPPCNPLGVPQRMNIDGPNGYHTVIMTPVELELPMGRYVITHLVSGTEASFDLVPNDAFVASCSSSPECIFQWWVTLVVDSEMDGASIESQSEQATSGPNLGSLEVHAINCPPGFTGPDFYNVCHGNGERGLTFRIESEAVFESATTEIEQSPGPGIARFENVPSGTYGLNFLSKFVEAPAYVFCSPDQGETVLVDQFLDPYHDPVMVPVYGQAVVCDWNLLN